MNSESESLELFICVNVRLREGSVARTCIRNMENLVPKMTFTFIEMKPEEEIYEVCISLKDVCDAVATTKVSSDGNVSIKTPTLFNAPSSNEIGY